MTNPGTFLRRLFETAVSAAAPHHVVGPYLPSPPAGRTVVVGAGGVVVVVVAGVVVVVAGGAVVVVGAADVVVVGAAVVVLAVSELPPQEATKAKQIKREIFFISKDHFFFLYIQLEKKEANKWKSHSEE